MHDELKQQLNKSIPQHITLTEIKKEKILQEAQKAVVYKRSSQTSKLLPAIVGAAVIGLSVLLSYPYVTENGQFIKGSLQEVTIPDQPYPVLINAEYNNQEDILIYTDAERVYSYSVDAKTETVLTEAEETAKISEVTTEDEWVVWSELAEGSSTLWILNQGSGEIQTIKDIYASDLNIDGSMLSYLEIGVENETPAYRLLNLATLEEPFEHVSSGEGADSSASFEDGVLAIPERVTKDGQTTTTVFVYNAKQQSKIGEFTFPYEAAFNVTLSDGKIFARLADVNQSYSVLAYIDVKSGELVEIETPEFWEYAVYENYVALSIPEGNSNTVKLYEIEGKTVKELPALSVIEERLVKPRFTEDGKLLVNGEGERFSMYLQNTKDID
ncbi:hypothetical protein [Planococcus shixiaomingii]|uniref:hypothetical protein n=1 Tax=Planococcus shixiaomingii TaxID=3058393 RepID=UPI00261E5534|nr:hypothetical protein [Planococcus sp. N022]WKA55000.1 hypothetical protein QWY21_01085 [Planococcus sp. N022]